MPWVLLAAAARAGVAATVDFALNNHVIYRNARNVAGNLIANVQHLQPGDRILLAYRQPPGPPIVHLCARIAQADNPVDGTQVIEQVVPPLSQELFDAGYDPVAPGIGEVIQLEDVHLCQFQLQGHYQHNAIQQLAPADEAFEQFCPQCANLEPTRDDESTSK